MAAVLWGLFVSPKSRYPLSLPWWLALQAALFGVAAIGLIAVGETVLGVAFGALVAVNLALVLFWHQRETVT